MKTLEEEPDEGLKRALDLPPDVAARVVRAALGPPLGALGPSRPALPPLRRWLPLAAALVLSLAVTCYLARGPLRPAPRRASITNVGDVLIATTPDGGRLLRSAGAQPEPSGTTLIVIHGDRP
jgi:hypothetical protein